MNVIVAKATGGNRTIFRMEIKTTRNGPFSIRLMNPLHSVSVNHPTRFHETRLTFPLAKQVSTTTTAISLLFAKRFDVFRNLVAIYSTYTNLKYHKQRLQIFDPIHSSTYPYFLLERIQLYLGISIRRETKNLDE